MVVGWDADTQILRYTQDPEYNTNGVGQLYRFQGSDYIVGTQSNKVGEPDVSFNGSEADLTFSGGYATPEVVKYTGTFSYLTNISPVKRQAAQTERIRLIIAY